MRKTLTISLPEELYKKLENEITVHHFGTTSSFIRHLIHKWFDEREERKFKLKNNSGKLIAEAIQNMKVDLDA